MNPKMFIIFIWYFLLIHNISFLYLDFFHFILESHSLGVQAGRSESVNISSRPRCQDQSDQSCFIPIFAVDSPLIIAAKSGSVECLKKLLEIGESANQHDGAGRTPLHLSCWFNQIQCIPILFQFHASIDSQDYLGRTALHISSWFGYIQVCSLLLESNASVDIQDKFGFTALHYAVKHKKLDVATLLVKFNANIDLKDINGVTPKSYAGGTFTVVTDKNTYTFETTKVIDASNVYAPVVIPMNLVAATPAEDYSGTYVVLAKEGSTYFALAGMNNNNTTRLDAVPFEYNGTDTPISVTDPEIVWTVTKSGNAYTLSNEGKYLSYSGSGNTAAVNSTPYNLTLLKDTANGTYNIKSETVSNRVLAKYNTDNAYFAFYTTGGNNNLYLVPVDYKQLPIIDLSTNSAILDYNDETVHEITATITDASSVIAAAYSTEEGSVESNWLVASYENGKISYFASVNNTDKARTAYIVVSATNANGTRKEIITVVQNIQAQGTEVTFNYGDLYSHVPSKGNVDVTEDTVEGVTAKYEKISGSNPPKYYDNGKNLRIYNKSMMTISAPTGSSIIKIEFTASKWTADSGTVTADIGTLTSKTWTGESEHVVFTFTATNNIESFVVTYK